MLIRGTRWLKSLGSRRLVNAAGLRSYGLLGRNRPRNRTASLDGHCGVSGLGRERRSSWLLEGGHSCRRVGVGNWRTDGGSVASVLNIDLVSLVRGNRRLAWPLGRNSLSFVPLFQIPRWLLRRRGSRNMSLGILDNRDTVVVLVAFELLVRWGGVLECISLIFEFGREFRDQSFDQVAIYPEFEDVSVVCPGGRPLFFIVLFGRGISESFETVEARVDTLNHLIRGIDILAVFGMEESQDLAGTQALTCVGSSGMKRSRGGRTFKGSCWASGSACDGQAKRGRGLLVSPARTTSKGEKSVDLSVGALEEALDASGPLGLLERVVDTTASGCSASCMCLGEK